VDQQRHALGELVEVADDLSRRDAGDHLHAAQSTVVTATEDWYDWHRPYDDEASPLSQRLRLVQRHITAFLDRRSDPVVRVVSACAGQGRDLLGVLRDRPDASRVRGRLVESDPRNAAVARAHAPAGIEVVEADAGELAAYAGAVPADLVLFAGVFGNIVDADIRATVAALPRLCAAGATVIWTRTREAPDLTPALRGWLAEDGFVEEAFEAPDGVRFSVGVHRLAAEPQPLGEGRLFTFVR
jgi:hypothetical protein